MFFSSPEAQNLTKMYLSYKLDKAFGRGKLCSMDVQGGKVIEVMKHSILCPSKRKLSSEEGCLYLF